jgi:hypothetical protein
VSKEKFNPEIGWLPLNKLATGEMQQKRDTIVEAERS